MIFGLSPELAKMLAHAYQWITAEIGKHVEVLSLLALSFIVSMQEALPSPFNKVEAFNWCYAWIREALLRFVNMRTPGKPNEPGTATSPKDQH